MSEDPRCCGTGTCIINPEGVCWCGQVWDGEKMCRPTLNLDTIPEHATVEAMIKKHFGV